MGYLSKDLEKADTGKTIKRRFKQIMYPYFMTNVILLPLNFARVYLEGNLTKRYIMESVIGIFYGRYMVGTSLDHPIHRFLYDNHPLWFLPATFLSCTLFYILKVKIQSWKMTNTICCIAICITISKLATYFPILLPWSIDTVCSIVVFLIVGNIAKQFDIFNKVDLKKARHIVILSAMLCAYIIMCKLDITANISIRLYGNSIILYLTKGILGSILCIIFFKTTLFFKPFKLFQGLGRMSLSLLCWHIFLFNTIDYLVFSHTEYTVYLLKSNAKWIYYSYSVIEILLTILTIYGIRNILMNHTRRNVT